MQAIVAQAELDCQFDEVDAQFVLRRRSLLAAWRSMREWIAALGKGPCNAATFSTACAGLEMAGKTQVTAGCARIHFRKNTALAFNPDFARSREAGDPRSDGTAARLRSLEVFKGKRAIGKLASQYVMSLIV